jgi:putative phosphoesterase
MEYPSDRPSPGGTGQRATLLGVISDTHGLLRPEALRALAGVDLILHAGDIGDPAIIAELEAVAPVTAVRGNMDYGKWAADLPGTEVVEVGGVLFYVLHDLDQLDLTPEAAGFQAVIFGHTHEPAVRWSDGVLYLNPGSAGPVRGSKPVSLALVEISEGHLRPRIETLL